MKGQGTNFYLSQPINSKPDICFEKVALNAWSNYPKDKI